MSHSTCTTLPSLNHTDGQTNTESTGKNATKESGRRMLPQSLDNYKNGVPRRRYANKQYAPKLDKVSGHVMDKTSRFKITTWLEERRRKETHKKKEEERQRLLDSLPSSVSSTDENIPPNVPAVDLETEPLLSPKHESTPESEVTARTPSYRVRTISERVEDVIRRSPVENTKRKTIRRVPKMANFNRDNPKTGVPRRHYAHEQYAPNLDEMTGYVMDKTLKFNITAWLKAKRREQKRRKKEEKRLLDSLPSSVSSTNENSLPNIHPVNSKAEPLSLVKHESSMGPQATHQKPSRRARTISERVAEAIKLSPVENKKTKTIRRVPKVENFK
ncbi:hypothetical protein GLOTRDRAFT_128845 [Gloeophyllum trabeum ATCC 11539]|uniref:Uncharacterized protein n=1 Tax=Gloeophyllum trabeum (strain ATCC 11539 / FP-39264 / Madison 617) TaxID=670483 RepID=S7RMG2_GLOTA|nr:uncharacterized protein GLOTRDRAFT_128845 [Gloeophyllum trabeum ATCC 11539]EPQ55625.1 hypothetical protein GLOTRDRAFT_128845 [Gloeophyllum trabeum ATCC 11539]